MFKDFDEVLFQAAMYWRIGYGAVRLFVGYKMLSFVGQPALLVYEHLMRRELVEDPQDPLFNFIAHILIHHGYAITYFLAAHFIFWGVIDIALSYAMIKHHLWAFTTSVFLIIAFVIYEIYRFFHTHSLLLLAFIIMDFFFIYLIRHEYNRLKTRKALRLEKQRNNNGNSGDDHKPNSNPTY